MGNNVVSVEDLSQGQDEHINLFFNMRINTINSIIDNHLKLKNNAKIAKLNENKLELSHYKEKLQIETTFLKEQLDESLKIKKDQIGQDIKKLNNLIYDEERKTELNKEKLDNDYNLKIETLDHDLEFKIKQNENIYKNKLKSYTEQQTEIENLIKNNEKDKIREEFIKHINNYQDKDNFNVYDCLNYFKNKPERDI